MIDFASAAYLAWADAAASTMIFAALRRPRRHEYDAAFVGRVLLVRPCTGAEPSLREALASTAALAGVSGLVVRFAVSSEEDPAAVIALDVCRELRARGLDASVVWTGTGGPNRKVMQIAGAIAQSADADVLVIADGDVSIDRTGFELLLRPHADARVGASWAAPVEIAPRTFGDWISASVLDASLQSFPLLASLDGLGMVSKLVAVRCRALDEVGGMTSLVDHLGEDVELARRLRAHGWAVEMTPVLARSIACGRSFHEVLARYTRWISVVRAQRAALLFAYPLLIASTPLLLSLALALGHRAMLLAGTVVFSARMIAAAVARSRTARPLHLATLPLSALVADVFLLVAFSRALASRTITWRGVALSVTRGGRLTERPTPSREREQRLRGAHP